MVIVGLDYGHAGQMTLDEITGGSPYGATTIAGGDGSRLPTAKELQEPGTRAARLPRPQTSCTANAFCPSHLIGIVVACKRNPKTSIRTEGRYRQATGPFPSSSARRKLNAVKGIPLWPVLGSPVGGVDAGAGLCNFYRAGERRRAQWRQWPFAALVGRRAGPAGSVSMMDR